MSIFVLLKNLESHFYLFASLEGYIDNVLIVLEILFQLKVLKNIINYVVV
jgi:hypothetical protein